MEKALKTEIKKVKGFSSTYPSVCNLKLLPNIDGTWITIQDDVGTSMTIKLSDIPQKPKTGYCKECKYFEYDSAVMVDGFPLIVAHEICNKWGDGCKTKEDEYCFLFEPLVEKEGSDKE